MAHALGLAWIGRLGRRRPGRAAPRAPIVASRDLPPLDPATLLPLPRSPEPLPDETLVFARQAARSAAENVRAPLSIADGADLRALLDRFRQSSRRRETLDQARQARLRLVEQLAGGKGDPAAAPAPHPVDGARPLPPDHVADSDEARLDRAMDEALASALQTLRRLSRPLA